MKLATFSISITKRIFIKLLGLSEGSVKIKVRSHQTRFEFAYFRNYLQTKTKTKFCNIFKTAIIITSNKAILESPYYVSSTRFMKMGYFLDFRTIYQYDFQRPLNLGLLLRLNCHNFLPNIDEGKETTFFRKYT